MKFISGLLTGIIVSSLFFLFYLKKQARTAADDADTTEVSEDAAAYESEAESETSSDFMEFYIQFHEDSIYQMEHIVFPLEGVPRRGEDGMLPENFKWEKKDWKLHKLFDDMDGKFVQYINEVNENLVIDQIAEVKGNFAMERRFAKIGKDWKLIYYAAMNDRTQQQ